MTCEAHPTSPPSIASDFFGRLGRQLDERWLREAYDEARFPDLAAAALREWSLDSRLSADGLIAWLCEAHPLPPQVEAKLEYPFTLFQNERFSIDALFWMDGSMDIHDHTFWGAFQVLSGSSIHARYSWTEQHRISSHMSRGELALRSVEELRAGDVRRILPGRSLVHTVFHLERPSVSILVATRNDPRFEQSFSYLAPGLAVNVLAEDQRRETSLRALSLMAELRPERYPEAMARFVASSGVDDAFHGLLHAFQRLDGPAFDRLVSVAQGAHGSLADLWARAFEENRRQANIVTRRSLVSEPVHRFFLAVVLNAPDRESILETVWRRFPNDNPIDTVMRWVRELAEIPVEGPEGPTAIGPPLGEAELCVLRTLMQGGDEDTVFARLARTFEGADDDEERSLVRELIGALRSSLFFGPLVTTGRRPVRTARRTPTDGSSSLLDAPI